MKLNTEVTILLLILINYFNLLSETSATLLIPKVFIIYSTGRGELRVKDVKRKVLKTTFKIQTEQTRGGIAVDWERDQIFFADGRSIYKIYLVDRATGKQKVTKKGELFTHPEADHFEVQLYSASAEIKGIAYDKNTKKLVVAADSELIKVDAMNGTVSDYKYVGYNRFVASPVIHNGTTYVYFHHGKHPHYGYQWGITAIEGRQEHRRRYRYRYYCCTSIVCGNGAHISGFTVDSVSGEMFVNSRSTIRMLNMSNPSVGINKHHIVLADSQFNKGLQSIAAYDGYILWGNSKQVYRAKLRDSMKYIPTSAVELFDGNASSQHLIIFEHAGVSVGDGGEHYMSADVARSQKLNLETTPQAIPSARPTLGAEDELQNSE